MTLPPKEEELRKKAELIALGVTWDSLSEKECNKNTDYVYKFLERFRKEVRSDAIKECCAEIAIMSCSCGHRISALLIQQEPSK